MSRWVSTEMGSSPRMRGAPVRAHVNAKSAGIIPAYAGSTNRHDSQTACKRDHPRVCGEHVAVMMGAAEPRGSSPRMRGAPKGFMPDGTMMGIIPAYAGSTPTGRLRHWQTWDHPRVCGEHDISSTHRAAESGSSPRMRGARGHVVSAHVE